MVPSPFTEQCSYPVRITPAIDYLVDGAESFKAIADAIEAAQDYVYVTCCYTSLNFMLCPPKSEQFLDLCTRAANRGVKVALLFWMPVDWMGNPDESVGGTVPMSQAPVIEKACPKILARWDHAKGKGIYPDKAGCHHQKTFVIDGKVAFVGGINMTQPHWDTPEHKPNDERRVTYDLVDPAKRQAAAIDANTLPLHDMFSKFAGPAVADVEANFIERWNGASQKAKAPDLQVGVVPPAVTTGKTIQVVRTIAPHTYPHTANGEESIKQVMLNAIHTARESVYFENQYFFDADIVAALRQAAVRGVRIVGLLARAPDAGGFLGHVEHMLELPGLRTFQWTIDDPHIRQVVQIYSPYTEGPAPNKDIYVHAKDMIVDDRYIIVGSANISFTSLEFHSEMAVLVDDALGAPLLRRRLFAEHLCLAMDQVPVAFAPGAELWRQHGSQNQKALAAQQPLPSRVVPMSANY
jgi:phosphatidylserine/phosphatidylglycerophosphate/cardiolipin synthase-like enzyme